MIVEYRFQDTDELGVVQWFEFVTHGTEGIHTVRRVFDISGEACTLKLEEQYLLRTNTPRN